MKNTQAPIVLADDSSVYRVLIKRELEAATGMRVDAYPDGETLLKEIDYEPLIILLDYHFDFDNEENNGSKTLVELRNKKIKAPVVLVTGISNPEFVASRAKEDFIAVIDKFDEDMIARIVEIILKLKN